MKDHRLIGSIVKFLESECAGKTEDQRESLQVAIQCIKHVYSIDAIDESSTINLESLLPDASKALSAEALAEAEAHKTKGNEYLTAKKPQEAIDCYTKALKIDPHNSIYFCNRAAAHTLATQYKEAVEDCKIAIRLNPKYAKAYTRLGAAYMALDEKESAREAYQKALQLEPDNQVAKAALETCTEQQQEGTAGPFGSGNMPDLNSLLSNPEIARMASQMMGSGAMDKILKDPSMMAMMQNMMGSFNKQSPPSAAKISEINNDEEI